MTGFFQAGYTPFIQQGLLAQPQPVGLLGAPQQVKFPLPSTTPQPAPLPMPAAPPAGAEIPHRTEQPGLLEQFDGFLDSPGIQAFANAAPHFIAAGAPTTDPGAGQRAMAQGLLSVNEGMTAARERQEREETLEGLLGTANLTPSQRAAAAALGPEQGTALVAQHAFSSPSEHYETVQNPFGLGGVGQMNVQTGQISNYQGPENGTSAQQDYRMAQSQGFQGSFLDYQEALAAARRDNTVINNISPPAGYRNLYDESGQVIGQEPIPGGPADEEPGFTDSQAAAAGFADRLAAANQILLETEGAGVSFGQNAMGQLPLVGNYLVDEEFQRYEQAQRDFVNSVLRRESGAAIAEQEFENARRQYFPQPGDSPEVVAQKRQARVQALDNLMREAGPAYQPPQAQEVAAEPGQTETSLPEITADEAFALPRHTHEQAQAQLPPGTRYMVPGDEVNVYETPGGGDYAINDANPTREF